MARTRTLQQMIDAVRRNTDNRDSQEFITDAEIRDILNEELAELHARMTMNEGSPHFRSQTDIAVTSGTALYPLPEDYFKVQEVVALISGRNVQLHSFMPAERADLMNTQFYLVPYGEGPKYRIQADNIEILPAVRDFTLSLYYTSACPVLTDPLDTTDGFDGYENAAIYGTSAFVTEMEKDDPSLFVGLKDRIMRQIDALAGQRDASHPERVGDVTYALDFDPYTRFP